MLINYLKIALRTLLKFKGYAAINLIGLALGLTTGILTMVYVLHELSEKADRIYRVNTLVMSGESDGGGSMDANVDLEKKH